MWQEGKRMEGGREGGGGWIISFLNTSPGLNESLKLIFGVLNKSRI